MPALRASRIDPIEAPRHDSQNTHHSSKCIDASMFSIKTLMPFNENIEIPIAFSSH
jgi:hypothetical protein